MELTPFKNCLAHSKSMFITTNGFTKSCCYFGKDLPSGLNWEVHKKMLETVDIEEACKHCINIEKSGTQWSHRQIFTPEREFVISIFFDSLCNQSCVTCFPEVSSSVNKEWFQGGIQDKNNFDRVRKINQFGDDKLNLVKDIVSKKPTEDILIEVYGGEPTSSPHLVPMVEWLVESGHSKNIILSLISNGSRVLKDIESHLEKFKTIKISFSIDGINDHFTYLRWPTKFETLQSNIDYHYELTKKHKNLYLGYNYTLSWMNTLVFFDFVDWFYNRYDNIGTYMTKLVGYDFFSVDILSDTTRNTLIEKAKNIKLPKAEPAVNFYIDYLSGRVAQPDQSKFQKAIDHMRRLDKVRNTNCIDLFGDVIKLDNANVK